MPPDATAAIDLQADSGPMYPAHGEEREGGGGFMGWLNSGIMTKVMEKTKVGNNGKMSSLGRHLFSFVVPLSDRFQLLYILWVVVNGLC